MKKLIAQFLLMSLLALHAETLNFTEEGLYISEDRVEATAGTYRVSGTLDYTGGADAAIILGLGAYDTSGNSLHGGNFFVAPTDSIKGLLEVALFNFDVSKQTPFDLRISLGGDTLSKIALALDIYMPEGSSLKIENLQIIRDGEQGGDNSNSSAGTTGLKNASGASASLLSNNPLETGARLDSSLSQQQLQQAGLISTTGGISIYINADTGFDTNSGLTSALAKETISGALAVSDVGEIILESSTLAYVASTISPAPGTTVVLRPLGNITIIGN